MPLGSRARGGEKDDFRTKTPWYSVTSVVIFFQKENFLLSNETFLHK